MSVFGVGFVIFFSVRFFICTMEFVKLVCIVGRVGECGRLIFSIVSVVVGMVTST